ncbi:MAG: diguanylate cyclase [Desulfobacteraceae bacterium]|nr:MAG: diguanylate cyclase [Desulfobacteraceae bacterium]
MSPSILIVDDSAVIRMTIGEYLRIFGYAIDAAENAEQALSILQSKKIDVVITDIKMNGGMDGLELTGQIKKSYDSDVIVITGHSKDYSYEEAIDRGADDIVFKPFNPEELLLRLKRVLRKRNLTQERDRVLMELKTLAITDSLTGLYNRRHFYHELEIEISRVIRHGHRLSLLLIDIDDFKKYNDRHGHIDGDKVLRKTADLIASCMRKMDSAYRYGGEEFTVILPETDCSSAVKLAQRIRRIIATHFLAVPDRRKITVSIGVTEFNPQDSLSEFVHRADKAMYEAKGSGRNQIACSLRDSDSQSSISAV